MKIKRKILIVGGTGFIGYHLIKHLKKKKIYSISSLSTKPPKKEKKFQNVKYLFCDIANKKNLKIKLEKNKFDFIVNLGGYVDHTNKKKTIISHYNGCKNLVEIFSNQKIKRFIQIGSSVEYGNLPSPQKENTKLKLKNVYSNYGKSKLRSTRLLLNYHRNFSFPAVILRLYIAFGPAQDFNRFIPIVIRNCLSDSRFPCSVGTQYRDFIYIEDLIKLIIKCLTKRNITGEIFNIGSGNPVKIKDVIKTILRETGGGKPQFGKIKFRKDEIQKLYPSILKAKKMLGWSPKVKFLSGLKRTIKYYEKKYF